VVALRQAIATGLLLMSAQVCQLVEALQVSDLLVTCAPAFLLRLSSVVGDTTGLVVAAVDQHGLMGVA
jgi:hypothetical protein